VADLYSKMLIAEMLTYKHITGTTCLRLQGKTNLIQGTCLQWRIHGRDRGCDPNNFVRRGCEVGMPYICT
jgi:hypothetical protein